jgi:pimeloyl-ACP methyl ester carboxylesterase
MPAVQVNDIQMYYEVHGEGEPLALIMGLGTDISEWETIIRPLAQHCQVIALDNRGAGRTDKPDRPYMIELMADDTAGLLKALDVERAALLGISMGGRIALALALAHPELVSRLVLVSTSAKKAARRPWWFGPLSLLSSGPLFRSRYPQPRYAFRRQLQATSTFDCTARLHDIHCPTLILHGTGDKITPYVRAEEMHAGIAGSELLPFGGSHLFLLFRERQRFLDAVTAFLGG